MRAESISDNESAGTGQLQKGQERDFDSTLYPERSRARCEEPPLPVPRANASHGRKKTYAAATRRVRLFPNVAAAEQQSVDRAVPKQSGQAAGSQSRAQSGGGVRRPGIGVINERGASEDVTNASEDRRAPSNVGEARKTFLKLNGEEVGNKSAPGRQAHEPRTKKIARRLRPPRVARDPPFHRAQAQAGQEGFGPAWLPTTGRATGIWAAKWPRVVASRPPWPAQARPPRVARSRRR